jgi:hypothetical protein
MKALRSEFSKPEVPPSDLYQATPATRYAIFTPPFVHRLEASIGKTCKLFMMPGATSIGLDNLVRSSRAN